MGVTLVPVSPIFTPAEVARVSKEVQEISTPKLPVQVLQLAKPRLVVTFDRFIPLVVAAQEGAGEKTASAGYRKVSQT